jgi:hypothetical protein
MNQTSFYCPQCQQPRLFQSRPMNHTPHILAAVFLCGLWLPIWIILAASYKDTWHCAFCGFCDAPKYLANPGLRQQELKWAHQQQIEAQRASDARVSRLSSMPQDTWSEKMSYLFATYPIPILVTGGMVVMVGLIAVVLAVNGPSSSSAPSAKSGAPMAANKLADVRPMFYAAALTGKSPKDVSKTLGKPTESWVPRSGNDDLMQSYPIGSEMTVEFHKNRIRSLVVFFSQKDVDVQTAYALVGLDYSKPKPAGLSDVKTGDGWVKIFY